MDSVYSGPMIDRQNLSRDLMDVFDIQGLTTIPLLGLNLISGIKGGWKERDEKGKGKSIQYVLNFLIFTLQVYLQSLKFKANLSI